MVMTQYELETLSDPELEVGLQGEYEAEEFFGKLAQLAQSPALRKIAATAARSALSGLSETAPTPAGAIVAAEALPEYEWEYESVPQVSPTAALMEHLGHAASMSENEAEAEAFIGALVPLAAKLLPKLAGTVMKAAPQLIKGVSQVTKALHSSPTTRPLIRAVPTIVRQTMGNVANQVANGRPVTAQSAVRTLARQTANVLGNPRQCAQVYRRSCALDHQYHRAR